MRRTWRRVGVGTIAVLSTGYAGLVAVSVVALVVASANLTVFLGQVHVQRTGSVAAGLAHSGDQLQSGDVVRTAHDTKAAVGYPDGSISRLDSDSTLQVKSITGSNGVWNYQLLQSNGKVWSRVAALPRGSSFEIDGPNSTTVELRGTEFEVIVDSTGGPTVTRVNSWRGAVTVAAQGSTVTLTGGQSSTVRAGAAPTAAAPISAADQRDTFTIFNFAVDAAQGAVMGISGGTLSAGQSTGAQPAGIADGTTDLELTLGWPGSKFELTAIPPATENRTASSDHPPIALVIPLADKGRWQYTVQSMDAKSAQPYWVVVSWRPRPAETASAETAYKYWSDSHFESQSPHTESNLLNDETGAQLAMDQAGLKLVAAPTPIRLVFTSGEYSVREFQQLYVAQPGKDQATSLALSSVVYHAGSNSQPGELLVIFARSPGIALNAAATAQVDPDAPLPALALTGDGYIQVVTSSESARYLVGVDDLGSALAADVQAGIAGRARDSRLANDPSLEGIIEARTSEAADFKRNLGWTQSPEFTAASEYPAYAYALADGGMLEFTTLKATFVTAGPPGGCVEQPSQYFTDSSGQPIQSNLFGPARGSYGTVTQTLLYMVAAVVPPKDSGQTVQLIGGRSQVVDWSTTPCTGSGAPGPASGQTTYF